MRELRLHTSLRNCLRATPFAILLVAGLVLGGCSAVNLTGFEMPRFGLMSSADDKSDAVTTASIPDQTGQGADQPTQLVRQ